MDYTNIRIKLMEEEIKQNKNKINILEKELNDTKTNKNKINILKKELNDTKSNNQKYKHTIYTSDYDLIYDINRNIDALDKKYDELDDKIDEKY